VEFADDLGFTSQQAFRLLLEVNRVLENLLERSSLFHGNLLELLLFGSIVEIVLLQEDACEFLLCLGGLTTDNMGSEVVK
jgi:hypothetical protein